MRRCTWKELSAVGIGFAAAACSTLLGLDAPPAPDAGATADAAAPPDDASGDASVPVCTPLDAGAEDATTTYSSLTPVNVDAGSDAWQWFDISRGPKSGKDFAGGTFVKPYVYFTGRSTTVARYDTGADFTNPLSWSVFSMSSLASPAPTGFEGAVSDGRYVYWIPGSSGGIPQQVVVRYDSTEAFEDPASWASFDTLALSADDGGVATMGFFGGTFDGRYLYLVPHNDGVPDGRVVRYDTASQDGGPTDFADLGRWSSIDLAAVHPNATGFAGAVFDGVSIYFAPQANNAFDGGVNKGWSSIAVRFKTNGDFADNGSWSSFDLTGLNGLAYNFDGAGFDGRYVYLAPRGEGIAVRFDTKSDDFASVAAWSTYDLRRVATRNGSSPTYAGAAFDGRFVYFIPAGPGFGQIARYDTRSTFTADCAWSTADLSQVDTGGLVPENFSGALFDGEYLYLVPAGNGLFGRFHAKSPNSMPPLPDFNGSFF